MHDFSRVVSNRFCATVHLSFFYFKTKYNKTIIEWGFCDIRNNQGPGKLSAEPKAEADNTYRDLD